MSESPYTDLICIWDKYWNIPCTILQYFSGITSSHKHRSNQQGAPGQCFRTAHWLQAGHFAGVQPGSWGADRGSPSACVCTSPPSAEHQQPWETLGPATSLPPAASCTRSGTADVPQTARSPRGRAQPCAGDGGRQLAKGCSLFPTSSKCVLVQRYSVCLS